MKDITKLKIRTGVLAGLIFALIIAGFNYYNEEVFSVFRFLLHFVLFGVFMGFFAKDRSKKESD